MGIVAAFDKMLFTNPTSKYCVVRLKTADMMIPQKARGSYRYRDSLTRFVAVGYDLPQTDSIQIDLEGIWVNSKHGLQLQVERWREVIPPTIEGIRGYLSSGLLKGIGAKTADAIVDRFGLASLDVIENHPERLLEIRGISEEKLEQIKTGYAESKAMRDLMILLAPFKVTPATAMKIYRHFGPGGVALLQQSPFRLCQLSGFGFRRVDDIVQKSGGNLQDPLRVQGAVFYALEKSRSEGGHLFVEANDLIPYAFLSYEKLRELGYEQPRAADYRLVFDAGLYRPAEQTNDAFLERVFAALNQKHPEGYRGRSLSISDVVELYHDTERKYYYCDTVGYASTGFSPMLAKPMQTL